VKGHEKTEFGTFENTRGVHHNDFSYFTSICPEFSWEVKTHRYCTKVARASISIPAIKHAECIFS
jgi:hypothetical protein